MELEGTLILERPRWRRWASVVAIVIPVVVLTAGTAWFIRAFVAPPMASIPAPMRLAVAPPAPRAQAEPQAPAQASVNPAAVVAAAQPAPTPPAPKLPPQPAATLPMQASLAAAPPALSSGTPATAYADPIRETVAAASPQSDAPMAALVPLPRQRPPVTVAVIATNVPLPRPRPVVEEPANQVDLPPVDRHAVE